MRKIFSVLIAVALVLSSFPGGTYAASGDFTYDATGKILMSYSGAGGDVTIPAGVTVIGENAFKNCYKLTGVTIAGNVVTVRINAFSGCAALKTVTVGDAAREINVAAFNGCTALTDINVAVQNAAYQSRNGVLYSKDGTELLLCPEGKIAVTFPEGVTSIGERAFFKCAKLTEIALPDGVAKISSRAFYGCAKLKSITIPASVTEISEYNVFTDCPEDMAITGAAGSKAQVYAEANKFKFVEYVPAPKPGDVNGDGLVNRDDVDLIAKYAAGFDVNITTALADISGDGVIDMRDATTLARAIDAEFGNG